MTTFHLHDLNNGLGVRSVLYFTNYKMITVVYYLYLRGRFCFLLEQKGGRVVDGPGAVYMLMLIPLSWEGLQTKSESHLGDFL